LEYRGDFGSLMSQHSWNGQQQHIPPSAASSFACQWLGAHQVFNERLAPGYNRQMFDRTSQVFDTASNRTYAPQDHPRVCSYFNRAITLLLIFPPYYPPHPHQNCFTQTLFIHILHPPTLLQPHRHQKHMHTRKLPSASTCPPCGPRHQATIG
jgi:hypothetical protein